MALSSETSSMHAPPTRRRRPWLITLPLVGVLVLAAGWTALWHYAAGVSEEKIAAFIDREAQLGRIISCGSRAFGGYPFRIELRCTEPSVEIRSHTPQLTFKAKEFLTVAQVYQPNLVIVEVTGPLSISEPGSTEQITADWTLAQLSLRGLPGTPERISVALDGVTVDHVTAAGADRIALAKRAEFHTRIRHDPAGVGLTIDVASKLAEASLPNVPVLNSRPFDLDADAIVRGLADLRPKPLPARLREWQAAGGKLDILSARLTQGAAIAETKGSLGLNAGGKVDGALQVGLTGFEQLMPMLAGSGTSGRVGAAALAGIAILGGKSEIQGRKAVTVPLRFSDGSVFFGPLPLGKIAPLF